MTSIHGQKGVISLIVNENEMPYYIEENKKVRLELLINPHAFPSRMTMGQIKEMGEIERDVYIKDNKIKNKILVGPCKYYALRHQVDDKFQYRNGGKFDIITKQPVRGRKNNGGLRFGQMERDILIGIGAWNTINEIWSIDKTKINICPISGKFNPNCCRKEITVSQSFVICLSYLRALGYDILRKDNKYSIIKFDPSILPKTDTLKFGDINPQDLRYKNGVILPICLRSDRLEYLYKYGKKLVEKEVRNLLKAKNGAFHKYVDGHVVNRSIRSVITLNPNLKIDISPLMLI
ncbi:hypothetical protein JA1_001781 [Spathaspora sp. JA1]|nr:hypothetical protein JA1_001781 [Spathaspora sp. JA1]